MQGGGGGGPAPMPHTSAAGVPQVRDPSRDVKKLKDGEMSGKSTAKDPKVKVEEGPDPMYAEMMALEEDDDGQTHIPVRLPLMNTQRLYTHETVTSKVEKQQAVQLGHEDRTLIEEDKTRASGLFKLREDNNDKLFFVQLPSALPISTMMSAQESNAPQRSAAHDEPQSGDAVAGEAEDPASGLDQQMGQNEWTGKLSDVEPGYMGKLRIHKSGKMVLALGDVIYEVSGGADCPFRQEVLVVNSEEETCHALGAVQDRLVVKLDPDGLLKPRRSQDPAELLSLD